MFVLINYYTLWERKDQAAYALERIRSATVGKKAT